MKTEKIFTKNVKIKNIRGEDQNFILKQHKTNNEYFKIEDIWVRNFLKKKAIPLDLNRFFKEEEIKLIIDNEIKNSKMNLTNLYQENFNYEKAIIISDGYGFEKHIDLIESLPPRTCLITVNLAAKLWNAKVLPTFMLISNPDYSCKSQMPIRVFPRLLASRRTNNDFLSNYKNLVYLYDVVPDEWYQSPNSKASDLFIDEYRNPICAALGLCNYFGVNKIFLGYCADAYTEERAGTVKIQDGFYNYPQQNLANKIIDASLLWYKLGVPGLKVFHTGVEKAFSFSRHLDQENFNKAILL